MAIAMPALPSPCPRIGHNSKWLEETWIEPSTIYNSLYTIPISKICKWMMPFTSISGSCQDWWHQHPSIWHHPSSAQ
jgi:hypothetical protein